MVKLTRTFVLNPCIICITLFIIFVIKGCSNEFFGIFNNVDGDMSEYFLTLTIENTNLVDQVNF